MLHQASSLDFVRPQRDWLAASSGSHPWDYSSLDVRTLHAFQSDFAAARVHSDPGFQTSLLYFETILTLESAVSTTWLTRFVLSAYQR